LTTKVKRNELDQQKLTAKMIIKMIQLGQYRTKLDCLNVQWNEFATNYMYVSLNLLFKNYRVKNNLKIPKKYSESVNRRRTDNTMTRRKSTTGQQRSTKHTHKTKDRGTRTPLKTGDELG
jgi:hypothetical protein